VTITGKAESKHLRKPGSPTILKKAYTRNWRVVRYAA